LAKPVDYKSIKALGHRLALSRGGDDFDRITRSCQRATEARNAHVLRHPLILYDHHDGHGLHRVVA